MKEFVEVTIIVIVEFALVEFVLISIREGIRDALID